MSELELQVVRLPHAADLPLPEYQTEHAAGLDLLAAVPAETPVIIEPHTYAMIPTGLCIALPPGTEGQVRPRSGLAAKHGVEIAGSEIIGLIPRQALERAAAHFLRCENYRDELVLERRIEQAIPWK